MIAPDVHPLQGIATRVRLGDGARVVWWGPVSDADGAPDVLALEAGRILTWPCVHACLASVRERGWAALGEPDEPDQPEKRDERHEPGEDDETGASPATEEDLRPVEQWLTRRRLDLPASAALDLWNLAGDVCATLQLPRRDLGRRADRCYDKLFAAVLPRHAGLEAYRPRWSPADLTYLRHRLGRDMALVRRELTK